MATLTRADTESILISRIGTIYVAVGLDGTTVDGTNVDLNDPIGYGIRQTGGTVASFVLVTDADVATVAEADYDEYLDISEYRALVNAQGNFTSVDIKVGPRSESKSQLGTRLATMIKSKKDRLDEVYGTSVGVLTGGVITLDFAEHDENNVDELGN